MHVSLLACLRSMKMENMKNLYVPNGPEFKTHLLWLQICIYTLLLLLPHTLLLYIIRSTLHTTCMHLLPFLLTCGLWYHIKEEMHSQLVWVPGHLRKLPDPFHPVITHNPKQWKGLAIYRMLTRGAGGC